ncbi:MULTISPECIES: dihydrofolate reductase family protein [unclassified Streptomyces]|uniref:dihydrofolate reductase family protein n=1 Tax=unclassified Streptomyces TaxID=2593676 RepID=UPI0022B6CB30|nr:MULTISPECIES: dihydrofolate reductase family protein [unclassified Streptomyces]MCZ7413215.1 dihydrofolate reductase family protein [Streptomyces sp. WMMC897]MCZ7430208.1 dihydrofolate reductase family protein [Streptomyces sp. WMMC1477]
MTTISSTMFLTLDGVMQGPGSPDEDRTGGFEQGGWAVPYFDEDMAQTVAETFEEADGFLLGRRTYELFAAHWPHVTDPDDPVATRLNTLPKYVATRTLDHLDWAGSHLLGPDVPEAVRGLRQEHATGRLQIHGSAALARALMSHGLVDEFRLYVFPVVLGTGMRLFEEGVTPATMELAEVRTTGSGVVYQVYRRGSAEVRSGTFTVAGGRTVRRP